MKRKVVPVIPEAIEHNRTMSKKSLHDFLKLLRDSGLDEDLLMKVETQISREIDGDKVFFESVPVRIDYLLNNPEENTNLDYTDSSLCPYCRSDVNSFDDICDNCGYSLEDLEAEIEELSPEELENMSRIIEKLHNDGDLSGADMLEFRNIMEKTGDVDDELNAMVDIIQIMNTAKHFNTSKSSIKYSFDEIPEEYKNKGCLDFVLITVLIDIQTKVFENFTFYGIFLNPEDLINELKNKEYLKFKKITNKEYAKKLNLEYSLEEIINILEEHELNSDGKKNKLIKRIVQNIPNEELGIPYPKLTKKGQDFLNEDLTKFYNKYLHDFTYNEFKEFYESSNKENIEDIAMEFLDKLLPIAEKREEYITITRIHEAKALIYNLKEEKTIAMAEYIKSFIMRLNYLGVEKQYWGYYTLINEEICGEFAEIVFNEGMDIVYNQFDKIWESIEYELRVSREDTLDTLEDLFAFEIPDEISQVIFDEYYRY